MLIQLFSLLSVKFLNPLEGKSSRPGVQSLCVVCNMTAQLSTCTKQKFHCTADDAILREYK